MSRLLPVWTQAPKVSTIPTRSVQTISGPGTGKSNTMVAMSRHVLRRSWGAGFRFELPPDDLEVFLRNVAEHEELVFGNGLPPSNEATVDKLSVDMELYRATEPILKFRWEDRIGQVFTRPNAFRAIYHQYLKSLPRAAVLLLIVPPPPRADALNPLGRSPDVKQVRERLREYETLIETVHSFLHTALLSRKQAVNAGPVNVVLGLSKFDLLANDPAEVQERMEDPAVLGPLRSILELLTGAPEVRDAALIPFSSFGLNNSEPVETVEDGPVRYKPRTGDLIPYNLDVLLTWIICRVLRGQAALEDVLDHFRDRLSDLSGHFYTIKGEEMGGVA